MTKYWGIAFTALAAVLLVVFLVRDRERLADELISSRAEVVQLQADAEFAAQAQAARDALDRKFFQEMADAKHENEVLRADVAAGNRRLLVKASCSKSVSSVAGASGVDDADQPALTAAAGQDYFRLRDQIIQTEKQLTGLQEYVRTLVQAVK